MAAAEEAPDIATLVSLVSKVRDEARSSAIATSKQVSAALDVCSRQLSLMREETHLRFIVAEAFMKHGWEPRRYLTLAKAKKVRMLLARTIEELPGGRAYTESDYE